MDSLPLTAALLGKLFPIKGSDIERYYKHHLSEYEVWAQKDHATDWVLLSENIGERLSIDETQLCEEVYTILSNKEGHGEGNHDGFQRLHVQHSQAVLPKRHDRH